MNESHEIKKLDVRINGRIDAEKVQSLRETCLEIIEKYFDLHGPAGRTIIIDKIQLDLGSIKTSHLVEELTVRLSYLLHTELQSFVEQPELEELMEQKVITSRADAFITYLKKGYAPDGEQVLSQLFEHFLQTNTGYLKEIIEEIKHSPAARKRLFYQVKFELLEAYWSKIAGNAYRELAKINSAILQDTGEVFTSDYNEQGIQAVLKKWTFEFMMGPIPKEKVMHAYLELLKTHVDDFKPHEQALKKSAFHYLEDLAVKLGTGYDQSPKDQPAKRAGELLTSILDEKGIGQGHKTDGQVHDLKPEQLKELAQELLEQGTLIPEQLDRIQTKLSLKQFEVFLRALMESAPAWLAEKISALFYLRRTISETFSEELFQLDTSFAATSLTKFPEVHHQVDQLQKIAAIIAAKKGLKSIGVTERLLQKLEKSAHREANTLKTLLKQVQTEEEASVYSSSNAVPGDLMGAFMHYLKSGVWVDASNTPEKGLELLLKENPQHLILQLNAHLGVQTVWLRLVYQHPVALLLQLFELAFKDDPGHSLLLNYLKKAASSASLQRKMLGAFVTAKAILHKKQEVRFEAFLKSLMTSEPSRFTASSNLAYLGRIISETFSEALPQLDISLVGMPSAGPLQLKAQLEKYVAIIAAKKRLTSVEVTKRLLQKIETADHKEAKTLKKLLKEIRSEIRSEEEKTTASPGIPKDLMGAYMHYLKFGVWIRADSTPTKGLEQLLNENPEHLIMQLNAHLGVHVVWLRLVYQHPVALLLEVFRLVFKDDPDLSLLLDHLKKIASSPQQESVERKTLEAFVIARVILPEERDVQFKALFEDRISELTGGPVPPSPADPEEAADHFDTLLAQFLTAENQEKVVPLSGEVMMSLATQQTHVLFHFLRKETISLSRWVELLTPLTRSQLLDLIRLVGRYTISTQWTGRFLLELSNPDTADVFERETLIRILLLLAQGKDASLKSLVWENWHDLQKKDPALIKKLRSADTFHDFSAMADTTDLSSLFERLNLFGTRLSWQEITAFEKELENYRLSLKRLDIVRSMPDLEAMLYDIVPLAGSLAEIKAQLLHRLSAEYPAHKEHLRAIIDTQDQAAAEKSLTALMKALIDAKSGSVTPYFKTFDEFERHLAELFRRTDQVFDLLFTSRPDHLVSFLERLSSETIEVLADKIDTKFSASDYARIYHQVLIENASVKPKIELVSIAYGLTHYQFDPGPFLEFLTHQIRGLQIPEITGILETQKAHLPALYVEGFIHFIRHQKYIFLPVELDGMTVALDKIITYWPQQLITQLRKTPDLKKVAGHLLDLIPKNEQEGILIRLFPVYRNMVTGVLTALGKPGTLHKTETLAAWIELALLHSSALSIDLIIDTLRSMLRPDDQPTETTPFPGVDRNEGKISKLPPAFLQQGIAAAYTDQFNVFDFIRIVIQDGQFPHWSVVYTRSGFAKLLLDVAKTAPVLTYNTLSVNLKTVRSAQNLLAILGTDAFNNVLEIVHKPSLQHITTTIGKLVKAHAAIGKKQALTDYFYTQYVPIIFSEYREKNDQAIFRILNNVAVDFGLSSTDYRTLLQQSTDPAILKYAAQLTAKSSERIITNETRTIDLLFHLILKNEIPWWASEKETLKPVDETIGMLTSEVLDKDPGLLLTAISKQARPHLIYEQILPHVANPQFDKILIVLSPNFGGFIISFNLLLNHWKKMGDKVKWHSFLLHYLVSRSTFYPAEFMGSALAQAASLYHTTTAKLSTELLTIAKKLIQDGEMRFLPFIELLKPAQTPEATPLTINEQEPVFMPADLIASVVHYLKTGSLPVDGPPQMTHYMAFAGQIERQLQFGHQELRLAIMETLAGKQVLTRVVRQEQEHFLMLLVSALYPSEKQQLAFYKQRLLELFRDKWPSISAAAWRDLFYQSVFEHVAEPHFHELTAVDLIHLFFQKAGSVFRQSFELTRIEMEHYRFGKDLMDKLIASEKDRPVKDPVKKTPAPSPVPESPPDTLLDQRVLIKNAGLVMVWPFLPRYFDLLEMTSHGKFKSEEEAIRGVHLLQYVATGSTSAPEHELLLNKVLCGLKIATPVPPSTTLTAKEEETTEMMLRGLLQNWEKLKSSSIAALREGFLMRDGYLIEKEKAWELKVDKKTLDILMEQLPWALGTIKISWMEKRLNVEWL